jgi:hypothetical protein
MIAITRDTILFDDDDILDCFAVALGAAFAADFAFGAGLAAGAGLDFAGGLAFRAALFEGFTALVDALGFDGSS